jgi:hypothetical protein
MLIAALLPSPNISSPLSPPAAEELLSKACHFEYLLRGRERKGGRSGIGDRVNKCLVHGCVVSMFL